MAARTGKRASASNIGWQQSLFVAMDFPAADLIAPDTPCNPVAVGKRRDGKMRYWCSVHKADATAKHGKPAEKCRAADIPLLRKEDILDLDLDKYLGGIALWGAVPAVYDTTRLTMDRGIHVHARRKPGNKKEMDWSKPAVRIFGRRLPEFGVLMKEIDAIYYMVTSIFGFQMSYVLCTHCSWPHLDKDWFSVHPHRRHLCAGCGKHFQDTQTGIGNPIVGARAACGACRHKTKQSGKKLNIRQSDYRGGIQLWGSNAAFLWTGDSAEDEGIHLHAYEEGEIEPVVDETYGEVIIDGVQLDPCMVRVLMAQNVMPSLKGRVRSMSCPKCNQHQYDTGEAAYTPKPTHTCSTCGHEFSAPGKFRNVVANPFPSVLAELAKEAPRKPQLHSLDLLPETL